MLTHVYILFTVVVLATAKPAEILSNSNNVGVDSYDFQYSTSDGTEREERGYSAFGVWTVTGSVSWIAPDGKKYSQRFIANDQGYQLLPPLPPGGAAGGGIGCATAQCLLGIGK